MIWRCFSILIWSFFVFEKKVSKAGITRLWCPFLPNLRSELVDLLLYRVEKSVYWCQTQAQGLGAGAAELSEKPALGNVISDNLGLHVTSKDYHSHILCSYFKIIKFIFGPIAVSTYNSICVNWRKCRPTLLIAIDININNISSNCNIS